MPRMIFITVVFIMVKANMLSPKNSLRKMDSAPVSTVTGMSKKRTIAILFHAKNNPRNVSWYSIVHSGKLWEAQGHKVVHLYGIDNFYPADICIVHIDLSVVSDEYLTFAKQYPLTINSDVRDIRKSSFSVNLLTRDSEYDQAVIVKTDLNYAGWPERYLLSSYPARVAYRLTRFIPFIISQTRSSSDYLIYESLNAVPERYFTDERFVVEKFLPERAGENYVCHSYFFMGSSYQCNRKICSSPIVKDKNMVSESNVEPHPQALKARERFGLDYGKLDYCIHEGEFVLLDVNKTLPYSRPPGRVEAGADQFHRENALESFFRN